MWYAYINTEFSKHASIGNCQITHHKTKHYAIKSINYITHLTFQ